MARNRYGWEKRAKELARKQKHDEKMKRRQSKGQPGYQAGPQDDVSPPAHEGEEQGQ